jgi:hypothetical protein
VSVNLQLFPSHVRPLRIGQVLNEFYKKGCQEKTPPRPEWRFFLEIQPKAATRFIAWRLATAVCDGGQFVRRLNRVQRRDSIQPVVSVANDAIQKQFPDFQQTAIQHYLSDRLDENMA